MNLHKAFNVVCMEEFHFMLTQSHFTLCDFLQKFIQMHTIIVYDLETPRGIKEKYRATFFMTKKITV